MRAIKNRDKAFTLTEMLVVAVTMSVVSLAVYSVFNNGIKIWQKVNRDIPEAEMGIFFDRFSSDLRNTLKFRGMNFLGERDSLKFACVVESRALEKRTIGEVSYVYDEGKREIGRLQRDFSQAYTKEDIQPSLALAQVAALTFRYYYYDKDAREYRWSDDWQREGLPLAVRVELEFESGREKNVFTETISIPSG